MAPEADGTFSATIVVPDDAPAGDYTVRGYCLTKVELGDGPNGFDPDSVAAGYSLEVGTLTVVEVSDPLVPESTTGTIDMGGDVRPRFTG